jgi:hypothetical protein
VSNVFVLWSLLAVALITFIVMMELDRLKDRVRRLERIDDIRADLDEIGRDEP